MVQTLPTYSSISTTDIRAPGELQQLPPLADWWETPGLPVGRGPGSQARNTSTRKASALDFLPSCNCELISCHFLGSRIGKPHPEPQLRGTSQGRVSEARACLQSTGSRRSWRTLQLQDRTVGRGCGNLAGAAMAWHCFSFKVSICCFLNF